MNQDEITQILTQRMRSEWDRRVSMDYRYWMSDGVSDDDSMWASGQRDFEILTCGLNKEKLKYQKALEVGCGIGRLLRPASKVFNSVSGIDVSANAIDKAKQLLSDCPNVVPILGNGLNLNCIESQSIDFAWTFAALSSMPVKVIASYLSELGRVVKTGGFLRLQMYLGKEQSACAEDTLAIRSFAKDRFLLALQRAGFDFQFSCELKLPFEVSDYEQGKIAEICGFRKNPMSPLSVTEIEDALSEYKEEVAGTCYNGSETEYLMALARAQQLLDEGREKEAKNVLDYAKKVLTCPTEELSRLMSQIAQKFSSQPILANEIKTGFTKTINTTSSNLLEKNLKALKENHPGIAEFVSNITPSDSVCIEHTSNDEIVLKYKGMPLSNLGKPNRFGEIWAERELNEAKIKEKKHLLVIGFADAYHLKALAKLCQQNIHVVEPSREVFRAAISSIDCTEIISRLSSISFSVDEIKNVLSTLSPDDVQILVHPQTQVINGDFISKVKMAYYSAQGVLKLNPSFAVIGPMWGGSLPIAEYVYTALKSMKQNVRYYDFQHFYKGFTQLSSFIKNKEKRNLQETAYVEMLSNAVLSSIADSPVDIVISLAQAPLSPKVLQELRAQGVITAMWFVEDSKRFLTWKDIAPYYDYIFMIQKGDVPNQVIKAGAKYSSYLPVACAPSIHRQVQLTNDERKHFGSELSFVGAGYNNRRHIFSTLANRDFKIWGTEWPACLPFTRIVQEHGRRISVEEYVRIFNASTININLHSSAERDGVEPFGDFVNPRTFELASCAAFQLVDNRELLPEMFEIEKEMATFSDTKEMQEKIDYYLAHPEERTRIIAASRDRVLREHTYEHRLRSMLETIYADNFEHLLTRNNKGKLEKTLDAASKHDELSTRLRHVRERGGEATLEGLFEDIQTGKGSLTETEQAILFLHHVKSQISYVKKLRKEDEE